MDSSVYMHMHICWLTFVATNVNNGGQVWSTRGRVLCTRHYTAPRRDTENWLPSDKVKTLLCEIEQNSSARLSENFEIDFRLRELNER